MDIQKKTREELIKELQELQQEFNSFQEMFHKNETELAECRLFTRLITENSTDMVARHDKQGVFLYVSPACRVLVGYKPEELVGHSAFEFFHPDDNQRLEENRVAIINKPVTTTNTFRFRCKNGQYKWLETITRTIFDKETNEVLELHASSRDITKRKNKEEELQTLFYRQQALLSAIPDIIVEVDKNKIYTWANPAGLIFFGEEVVGKEAAYYFEGEQETYKIVNQLFEGSDDVVHIESWQRRKDGEKRLLSWWCRALKDNGGNVIGALSTAQDITEKKILEEARDLEKVRLELQLELHNIMDTPQDQLFDYMLDALIRSMQSRFSFIGTINKGETVMTIYAWSKDTMKECAIPASPRLFPISEAGLWGDCVRQRKPIIVNSYSNSPHKKGIPAGHVPIERFMAVPVFDGGKIVAVAAVANKTCDYLDTDAAALENLTNMLWGILRRRQTSEEIKRKNEELQLLNAEKEKFYGIIAHDLRSPFASLLGFSKMLEEELPKMTREQIQKIAGTLRKSATNCYSLLENLLDWSQLQRGLITYNPEPVLLMSKVMTDTAMIMESANKKGIDLSYNIPEDLVVFADENMLGGILRNLASNAVKFTLKGGKVDIAAKPISNEWVEVSFKDTGVGMSKEMIRNLFLADVNTSRRGTEGEPSSGLGLIICKEFIEKHNGRLWIESNEDKGSAFYFTLPSKER